VDSYRELSNGLVNTYMSAVGLRTNEIMKFLTIIGAIFIPLTFLAGLYGMNFHHMPELDWYWAYPTLLAIMAMVAGAMLYFFKSQRMIPLSLPFRFHFNT
jgi:magnesium transporter